MKNNPLKVAVIGGGSSYTPELIEGFIERHAEFPIDDLYLADIEEGSGGCGAESRSRLVRALP